MPLLGCGGDGPQEGVRPPVPGSRHAGRPAEAVIADVGRVLHRRPDGGTPAVIAALLPRGGPEIS